MNRKELRIKDVANLQSVSANSLVAEYGYKAIRGKTSSRVNSGPNLVRFGKGEGLRKAEKNERTNI